MPYNCSQETKGLGSWLLKISNTRCTISRSMVYIIVILTTIIVSPTTHLIHGRHHRSKFETR